MNISRKNLDTLIKLLAREIVRPRQEDEFDVHFDGDALKQIFNEAVSKRDHHDSLYKEQA